VYVADESNGLVVFDVSVPKDPIWLSAVSSPGAIGIDREGSFIFLAERPMSSGPHPADRYALDAIDVADPAFPVRAGWLEIAGELTDLDVSSGLAHLTSSSAGLVIVDIANPEAMNVTAEFGFGQGRTATAVVVRGTYAFVAVRRSFGEDTIYVIDVSDPHQPIEVAAVVAADLEVLDMTISGDALYVAREEALPLILDISNPVHPAEAGVLPIGYAEVLHVHGARLFASTLVTGIVVLGLIDPLAPEILGVAGATGSGLAAVGDFVYVALGGAGLGILDVTVPGVVPPLAEVAAAVAVRRLASWGDRVVVGQSAVQVFDVSIPGEPVARGWLFPPGGVGKFAFDGEFIYVLNGDATVVVIDARDPDHLAVVGSLSVGTQFLGAGTIEIDDRGLLWVSVFSKLVAVDVSDPASPDTISTVQLPQAASFVRRDGDVLYVGMILHGLLLLDVTDPVVPTEIVHHPEIASEAIWFSDSLLIAAAQTEMTTWTWSDPLDPALISRTELAVYARKMQVADGFAYVSGHVSRPEILDVSDPANVESVGIITPHLFTGTEGLAVRGDHVFVAAGGHLLVFPRQCPVAVDAPVYSKPASRLRVSPNPSRTSVTIESFGSTERGAPLEIFDAGGRKVRVLEGNGRSRWDGRDEWGSVVAPGVYFVRVLAGERASLTKVVRVR
jgi:hypothetical protein